MLIGGTTVMVKVAHVRLCHSRMLFVRAPARTRASSSLRPRNGVLGQGDPDRAATSPLCASRFPMRLQPAIRFLAIPTNRRFHCGPLDGLQGVEARCTACRVSALGWYRLEGQRPLFGKRPVGYLLGAQVLDPDDAREKDLSDKRIKAGVIIAAPGVADMATSSAAARRSPASRQNDFSKMTGPALVVAGDKDLNPAFSTRLGYRWDAYTHSPAGNKTLLTFFGGEHILGGIAGHDSAETTDESPERVAALRALVWAYLRSRLYPEDTAWRDAVTSLESGSAPMAKVESR